MQKIVIPTLVAALSVGATSVVSAGPSEKTLPPSSGVSTPPRGIVNRVVAVVDHRVITQRAIDRRMKQQFEKQLELVPAAERPQKRRETRAALVETMIDELVIDDAATRLRVSITENQVDEAIEAVKQTNKIDAAGLAKALADAGMSDAEYRQELRRQLVKWSVGQREVMAHVRAPRQPEDKFLAAYEEAFRVWLREERETHYVEVKP